MGHKNSREEMVEAISAVVLTDGLSGLTYRRVAEKMGTSDRMVVYYFPAKEDLVMAAVVNLSGQMQSVLEQAFGDERRTPQDLVRIAWPVLRKRNADRVFQVFLEAIGLAAARIAPYDQISKAVLEQWSLWLAERVDAPSAGERRRGALAVMAKVDGLLLLRHAMSPKAADDAAVALGLEEK